jgi:hypothetical protein
MQKVYVCKWERDVAPNDDRFIYQFCTEAKDAAYWNSRYLVEVDCLELNRGVTIPSGGTYLCKNFQVEQESPDRFVICCEAPSEDRTGAN